MDSGALERVRSFNRTVAERTGTASDRFLGRPRPYGESRVLWHIGPDGLDVRDLRSRLALDSGYVSRVLQSLRRQRLVKVQSSRADGRVRHVKLTAAGRAERDEIDRRSNEVASAILEPLSANERTRLLEAMLVVESLLCASMIAFRVEDPTSSDARWCLEQYFAELDERFDAGFDPARSLVANVDKLTPPAGAFVIARLRHEPVGCGAVIFQEAAPAYIKRMWLARRMRGMGLGRRMLCELEQQARRGGADAVCLETNRSLTEAIALYRSAGYREVAPFNDEFYAHHWFEKNLT